MAQQLAADTKELLDRIEAAIKTDHTEEPELAIGSAEKEEPIISTAAKHTGHIEATAAINISRIKAAIAAGIALVTDRIAITFYLYYKNLNYFAT